MEKPPNRGFFVFPTIYISGGGAINMQHLDFLHGIQLHIKYSAIASIDIANEGYLIGKCITFILSLFVNYVRL